MKSSAFHEVNALNSILTSIIVLEEVGEVEDFLREKGEIGLSRKLTTRGMYKTYYQEEEPEVKVEVDWFFDEYKGNTKLDKITTYKDENDKEI